jgi:hypothetical protein
MKQVSAFDRQGPSPMAEEDSCGSDAGGGSVRGPGPTRPPWRFCPGRVPALNFPGHDPVNLGSAGMEQSK